MFDKLSIRSKLLLMLLFVSIFSSVFLIYIGYSSGKTTINQGVFNKLTSIRASKQYQIEAYFKNMASVVETIGGSDMTIEALEDFKKGYNDLTGKPLTSECKIELSEYYTQFIDILSNNVPVKPHIELFYPNSGVACYLQGVYIAQNPFELGNKHQLLDAKDETLYNEYHKKYHNYFKGVVERFGFYDLFLIDLESGNIVYSVFKETDFATSLYSGPYRSSNLAGLVQQLKSERDLNKARIVDFESYRPSYGKPASFIGIPVIKNSETVGVLALQLPVEEINKIMTGDNNWNEEGLGNTGETYLVGEDYYMRSISRFFVEDSLNFKESLLKSNASLEEVNNLFKLGTTILTQRVKTKAIDESLKGNANTEVIKDYRGSEVLSSYAPLEIPGLKWSIVSEQDLSEAELPIKKFQKKVLITLFIILLLVSFLASFLAGKFVKPIDLITEGVQRIQKGDLDHQIPVKGKDEISKLGMQFNSMITNIKEKSIQIEKQTADNKKLLLNFIPESIALRLQNGESSFADNYPDVSLVVIDIIGFNNLTKTIQASKSIDLLNNLIDAIDGVAEKYQIEKLRTVGDTYFATCGMFRPRLDHSRRVLDFAFELLTVINQFNINHQLKLALGIGVHSGEVTAGIIGMERFSFDLVGSSVSTVFDLKDLAEKNTILASSDIQNKLSDFYHFEKTELLTKEGEAAYKCVSSKKRLNN